MGYFENRLSDSVDFVAHLFRILRLRLRRPTHRQDPQVRPPGTAPLPYFLYCRIVSSWKRDSYRATGQQQA